jgi:hypothetical protein
MKACHPAAKALRRRLGHLACLRESNPFEDRGVQTLKNIVARRTATAARRQETAIVRVVTQTIVAAANDIALCANS